MFIKNNIISSYKESIRELRDAGVIINDYSFAESVLKNITPYRLKQYSLFHKEILFEDLFSIYTFDCELRSLFFPIIEAIEISFRSKISLFMKSTYGSFGYLKEEVFENSNEHLIFISKLNKIIKKNEKEKSDKELQLNLQKYGSYLPIEIAIDLFSFGMLSKFYANFKEIDKQNYRKICHYSPKIIKNLLHCLTYFRNLCAHGSRLYNKIFTFLPILPKNISIENRSERKLWLYTISLYLLYPYKEEWDNNFYNKLKILIQKY